MTKTSPPINPTVPFIWHGADYYPEQWPPEVWPEDFKLMQQANMTVATVGVFGWNAMQPDEDTFTFDWLDTIINGLYENGIYVVLATPTAAQPAWMSQKYPEMMRSDEYGKRREHGTRVKYCPNSADYRRFSGQIAQKLAERYSNHPAVILWHISNEYTGQCMCDTCAAEFREWLKAKYGTLDELNHRWWTTFWSHTYTDWSQIMPPRHNGETLTHGLNLDYMRFMSESQLACYTNERDIIRAVNPNIPITTNLMSHHKGLDYRQWAKEMDIVAWDNYPTPHEKSGEIAFMHAIMRGLKDGQPFLLMEQTPSTQNWQPVNQLKRPGVMRLWSYQAVAHGAESVMYFQWRRGRGGSEKFHGAIVEHAGRTDTRVFKEIQQLGAELKRLGDSLIGARATAEVGVVLDWENWHALDDAIGYKSEKRYYETVCKHYLAFHSQNIPVDVVYRDTDLSDYKVIVAPMLYLLHAEFAERVREFVSNGGTFITTYLSGIVDETDLAFETGYPGLLQDVLGLWVEETDALYDHQQNSFTMGDDTRYSCGHLADLLQVTTADVLASYNADFYAGMPVITRNTFGKGTAYYIASDPEPAFLQSFYEDIAEQQDIRCKWSAPHGVEVLSRQNDHTAFLFILNHTTKSVAVSLDDRAYHDVLLDIAVSGTVTLTPYDVRILKTPV